MTSAVPAGFAEAGLASNEQATAAVDRDTATMDIRRTIDADKDRTSWGLFGGRRLDDSCGRYVPSPESARTAGESRVTDSPTQPNSTMLWLSTPVTERRAAGVEQRGEFPSLLVGPHGSARQVEQVAERVVVGVSEFAIGGECVEHTLIDLDRRSSVGS
jgi:hypothetical protein